MPLKVGVTSGIYYAARAEELSTIMRKLGYTLTRGTAVMEIPADVAHEVPYTQGYEIRHIAKKQGVTLNFHGDLSVPFEIPERGEWRDAQDRVEKSIRSAVYLGAKYIDFHACLNIWLELVTYTGRKLTMSFCDHEGRFLSHILRENQQLREWFVEKKGDTYYGDVVNREEQTQISSRVQLREDRWRREQVDKRAREMLASFRQLIVDAVPRRPGTTDADVYDAFVESVIEDLLVRGLPRKQGIPTIDTAIQRMRDQLQTDTVHKNAEVQKEEINNFLREKFKKPLGKSEHPASDRGGRWESEELRRAPVGMLDGYHIMGHYLFYTKDPHFVAMAGQYQDLMRRYRLDYGNFYWLDDAWKKAEDANDREFKEWFYAMISAKFLEGHLKAALKWIDETLIKKEIPAIVNLTGLPADVKRREIEELTGIAKRLVIGIENPDAREAQHAGMYFLWRPKQIYAAVKTIRQQLKTDRVMLIVDHEHIATQGIDVLDESRRTIKTTPDYGELAIAVHANHPNPLHPHNPLDLGDVDLYELLYNLRLTGLGTKRDAYLVFERGGGQDPFQRSVDILREMARFLETGVKPADLPMEFFGMKGLTAGDIERQRAIVKDKAWEPLKDLLHIPEEDWSMMSQEVLRKGRKPEAWKRGEFR